MTVFKKQVVLVFPALLMIALAHPALAAVETETVNTFKVAGEAIDTTVSGDGNFLYVLTGKGVVEVFSIGGGPKEEIHIDGKADKIAVSQSGDALFLTDSQAGTTRMVSVDYVQKFDLEGSPFKGPESASVAIVIFSDFQ